MYNYSNRNSFIPEQQRTFINEFIIPNCKIIFLSNKQDDNKYVAAGIIIERTLKFLVKLRDQAFELRGTSIKKLVNKSYEFPDFPRNFGVFLIYYWEKRNYEAHTRTICMNEQEIINLRNHIFQYLDWFFANVFFTKIISELENWESYNSPFFENEDSTKEFAVKESKNIHRELEQSKKDLLIKLTSSNGFSRTYFENVTIDRNELRGVKLVKTNQDLIGLKLHFIFQNAKASMMNESENLKIICDNSTLSRNEKKTLSIGEVILFIDDIQFRLLVNQF